MDITYDLYKVFHCVAKNLSFTIAAQELFLTQSAVSQNIKQLEQKLSCTLFYRTTKSVRLTADGKLLYDYINQGIYFFNKAEKIFIERQQLDAGEIRLASTDTICKYFLLSQIKDFHIAYPNIKFTIVNRTSLKCLELLERGEVDLVVANIPHTLNEKIYKIEKYIQVYDAFVLSTEIWKNKKYPTSLLELSQCELIVLDKDSVTRKFFDNLFLSKNIQVSPEIELSSIDLLIEMTKAGLGIGFVPTYCIKSEQDITALEINENCEARKLGLVTLGKMSYSNPINHFIKMVDFDQG